MHRPLADEIRPSELGRRRRPENILARAVSCAASLIPATSRTWSSTAHRARADHVANIIARRPSAARRLNATNAGLADRKAIIAERTPRSPRAACCSISTRYSISTKTAAEPAGIYRRRAHHAHRLDDRNPYFDVHNALLSRSTVFEFKSVPAGGAVLNQKSD